MWTIQMIDNYANLHDCFLSDALVTSTTNTGHIIKLCKCTKKLQTANTAKLTVSSIPADLQDYQLED